MKLKCYLFPGWEPRIRAATTKREWMDGAPESFPYRCLPLAIANGHGWDILSPCGFEAEWNGGLAVDDVTIRPDPGTREHEAPVALFGQGTFTMHIQGLFRTDPGWNLWVSGPPNCAKNGVAPLTGIIETDWAPYTFTMNWKLTRPNLTVRFEENEIIAHIFPIQRSAIEAVEPEFLPIADDPELKAQFEAWSTSRNAFHDEVRANPPQRPADKWQKLYYRGLTPDGKCPVTDHRSKLNVKEFANSGLTGNASAAMAKPVKIGNEPVLLPTTLSDHEKQVRKYEWIMETQQRQRQLSAVASGIFRCEDISSEEFLDEFYAPGRAVVLADIVKDWPAFQKWSPEYLREKIGNAAVEFQGGRSDAPDFERAKDSHKQRIPFDAFIDLIQTSAGNNSYITAYNSSGNAEAFRPLFGDLGRIDALLAHNPEEPGAMMWIGSAGTFTPLHHDLTNNLLVQLVGRKRIILASPLETPKLYNDVHVFSEIADLANPAIDFGRYPRLNDVRLQEVVLNAGDALFIPIGWWHQVTSLDFSVSATYTNFKWPNLGWESHPDMIETPSL